MLKADAATGAARLRAQRYVNRGHLIIHENGVRPLDPLGTGRIGADQC